MRRIVLCMCLCLPLVSGCAHAPRRPRWEIAVNIQVEDRINPNQKVSGGITLKRPTAPAPK